MIITDENQLRVKCEDVLPGEVEDLIRQLEYELELSDKNGFPGIGLAAPQIGISKKAAIIRIDNELKINLINCKISDMRDEFIFSGEGCLSFPGRFIDSKRCREIYVTDNLVYPYSFIARNLMAVVIQHELDHLDGKLLIDRI